MLSSDTVAVRWFDFLVLVVCCVKVGKMINNKGSETFLLHVGGFGVK